MSRKRKRLPRRAKPKKRQILGPNFDDVAPKFEEWLIAKGRPVTRHNGGYKLDLPLADMIEFLDAAGIDYAILDE